MCLMLGSEISFQYIPILKTLSEILKKKEIQDFLVRKHKAILKPSTSHFMMAHTIKLINCSQKTI